MGIHLVSSTLLFLEVSLAVWDWGKNVVAFVWCFFLVFKLKFNLFCDLCVCDIQSCSAISNLFDSHAAICIDGEKHEVNVALESSILYWTLCVPQRFELGFLVSETLNRIELNQLEGFFPLDDLSNGSDVLKTESKMFRKWVVNSEIRCEIAMRNFVLGARCKLFLAYPPLQENAHKKCHMPKPTDWMTSYLCWMVLRKTTIFLSAIILEMLVSHSSDSLYAGLLEMLTLNC